MQLLNFIGLSAILILTSYSEEGKWEVKVEKRNIAVRNGSTVTIDCKFHYPQKHRNDTFQIYWKTEGKSACRIKSNDNNAFIFHPNQTCVNDKYKGKTRLIGNENKGNCSLQIQKFMDSQLKIYLRVVGSNDCYSFKNDLISIFVKESGVTPPTLNPDFQTFLMTTIEPMTSTFSSDHHKNPNLYMVISIPLAALLVIVVTGILIHVKHKRSQSFTREESGYYVNFSRASSNPPNSETSGKSLDIQHPEPKVIDEPVYINTEMSTNPMDQSMDHTDNVYANVDYS